MLTTYAVLDGFDFGAGIVHLFVAKTETERRTVLAAIGPVWDGNEVWLIAAGGALFFAFPQAYAAGFSGFYLPLMLVIVARHPARPLDRDALAARAPAVAPRVRRDLRRVVRDDGRRPRRRRSATSYAACRSTATAPSGYFHEDLFAARRERRHRPTYTGSDGASSPVVVVLAAHGATFLAWKTEDMLHARSVVWATQAYRAALGLAAVADGAHVRLGPRLASAPSSRARGSGPCRSRRSRRARGCLGPPVPPGRGHVLAAFLASCAFLAFLLVATAASLFPTILRSTVNPAFTLDTSSASAAHGLAVGFGFWALAVSRVTVYFVYLFRSFRGKVRASEGHD